ncbi:MAG: tetratricopeptide repeat protein, partial [Pseudomonadota bacterium]
EPVRLFAIVSNGAGAAPGPRPTRRRLVRSALVALGAAGVVTGGLAFVAPMLRAPRAPSSAQPVIAVLPFRDRSIPPDPSYFSEGITEDVIGLLGRFPELLVLSWSAMGALGSNADASRIAELGADYLVSGSLQRTDERLRASIQLSDAEDGHLLWSESYDQPIADIFVIQDEISRAVVEALAVRIERLERQRAKVADPDRLGAYELVLRGRSLMRVPTREDNLRARTAFEDALERDPDYAAAHVGLGWTHRADFLWGWSHSPPLTFREAERHARAAIAADPENAAAHALLADVLRFTGAVSEAEVAIARALELNPSAAVAQAIRGSMVLYEGSAAAAIAPLETARRLDPALPSWTIATLARAYYFEGRYQDAISTIADGTTNMGEDPAGYAVEAAAQAQLGNLDAARRAAEKVRRIYPFFDAAVFARNVAPADTPGRLLEGLRKAGL